MEYLTAYSVIMVHSFIVLLTMIKRSSGHTAIVMLGFMWSLCVFCTEAYDLQNMKYVYENFYQLNEKHALLYDFFLTSCVDIGLSFTVFKAIIAIFSLSLTYMAIKKGTHYTALAIGLYAIYPFFGTITQIRNGMMAAIVMYSLICFILDPKHSIWKYVSGIILACMFHPSAAFYLIFVLAKRKVNNKNLFICIVFLLILINMIIKGNVLHPMLSPFIGNERVLQWLDFNGLLMWNTAENNNWKTQVILALSQMVGYILFYTVIYHYKKYLKKINCNEVSRERVEKYYYTEEILDFANRVQVLLFCALPLYLLSPTFYRFYYDVILLIYIIAAQYFFVSIQSGYRKIVAVRLCAGFFLYAFLLLLMISFMQGGAITMLNSYGPGGD